MLSGTTTRPASEPVPAPSFSWRYAGYQDFARPTDEGAPGRPPFDLILDGISQPAKSRAVDCHQPRYVCMRPGIQVRTGHQPAADRQYQPVEPGEGRQRTSHRWNGRL